MSGRITHGWPSRTACWGCAWLYCIQIANPFVPTPRRRSTCQRKPIALQLIDSFDNPAKLLEEVEGVTIWFSILAGITLVSSFFEVGMFMYTGGPCMHRSFRLNCSPGVICTSALLSDASHQSDVAFQGHLLS